MTPLQLRVLRLIESGALVNTETLLRNGEVRTKGGAARLTLSLLNRGWVEWLAPRSPHGLYRYGLTCEGMRACREAYRRADSAGNYGMYRRIDGRRPE